MDFLKILGVGLLVLVTTTFLGVLLSSNSFLTSSLILVVTYSIIGYLSAKKPYPYSFAYKLAFTLVCINIFSSQFFLGVNVLENSRILFFAMIIGIGFSFIGVFIGIKRSMRKEKIDV